MMKKMQVILLLVCFGVSFAGAAEFYVSPTGSDANPGTKDKPFATLIQARNTIREIIKQGLKKDITVFIRGGTYKLKETVYFGPQDSGTAEHPITYTAYPNETPIVSGGKQITDWQPDSNGRWKAKTDIDNFRQLYVNGRRAVRAQAGRICELELYGDDGYRTKSVELAGWRNPSDIELTYVVAWTHTRCKVESITKEGDYAIIKMKQPEYWLARMREGRPIDEKSWAGDGKYATIENAFELLDEPGEWYLDRAADTLCYIPQPGQDMRKAKVIAPVVEKLLELKGELYQPVHDIRFSGITFAHASWLQPSRIGLVDMQANFIQVMENRIDPENRGGRIITVMNEHIKCPSNIVCHRAESIKFEKCTFTKLGSGGIDLEYGSQNNVISGCHFYDISGTAIQVGDVLRSDHHPDNKRMIVKNNQVVNNLIENCAVEYQGGMGIFAGYTDSARIAHNEIRNLPSYGISIGWGWAENDAGGSSTGYYQPYYYATPTPAKDNLIEYNHIHHVMQKLTDGGAIYTLGDMPGTIIRGNHIHDNRNQSAPAPGSTWGPGGIYFDAGRASIELTDNLVYNVPMPTLLGNLATCNVHDNFFGIPGMQPTGPAPCEGKIGMAFCCYGSDYGDDFFEVPHSPDLEPADMTIEAWVKMPEIPGFTNRRWRRWIVNKNSNETTKSHYALVINGDKVVAYLNIAGGLDSFYEATSEPGLLKPNRWHHIAMTYDSADLKVYCDGLPVASKTVNKERIPGTSTLVIGRRQDGSGYKLTGAIDEVSLYNQALTAKQIKANYLAIKQEKPDAIIKEGLVRHWSFEEPAKDIKQQTERIMQIVKKAGLEPAYRHMIKQ